MTEHLREPLGDRMKERYENRFRFMLPRRTYTIIRVDGKAFHSYTKSFERPFDSMFADTMDRTAIELCQAVQGVQIGYVQSDEISLVLTDFETISTEAWFDGNLQKIVSVAASIATKAFNALIGQRANRTATFDARAFTIPDRQEVLNYLIWRQQDASRNSVQQAAQSLYSQSQLHGKNNMQLHELMFAKGVNWDEYQPRFKRGAAIVYTTIPGGCESAGSSNWSADQATPIFTQERSYLESRIPFIWASTPEGIKAVPSIVSSI